MITPTRIALLKACCIGDVVFATPLLAALRRAFPESAIDWWVSDWALDAIREHPAITRVIPTGAGATPANNLRGIVRLAGRLRAGRYDWLIVPDRSPRLSMAAWLSGIPVRAGLDSAGRGFGYTVRAPINPTERRHEAEIYLDVARRLSLDTRDCWVNSPASERAIEAIRATLRERGIGDQVPLILIHPGGGVNPGMTLTSKRWPPDRFAALAGRIAEKIGAQILVLGGTHESELAQSVVKSVKIGHNADLSGVLSLTHIAALAALPQTALYIGNDNGVAHLSAAAGARVLMIFGPSDPLRYAPFVPADRAAYAWRPFALSDRGVIDGAGGFDWERDGVSVEEAWQVAQRLMAWMGKAGES